MVDTERTEVKLTDDPLTNIQIMAPMLDAIRDVLSDIESKGYDATNKENGAKECLKKLVLILLLCWKKH